MTERTTDDAADVSSLIESLGGSVDRAMIELAMTHRSYAYENGGLPTNERLEFLGDAVLGVVITEELFRRHADLPEGQLAKLRAAIVNSRALAVVGRTIEVGRFVRLGRGEQASGGREKASIIADAVEALIGAYYLDRGTEATRRLVLRLFANALDAAANLGAGLDWKTSLQELAAERVLGSPEYVVQESGPDHQKAFHAKVVVDGAEVGEGRGNSKKQAEQLAAEQAWNALSGTDQEALSGTDQQAQSAEDPGDDA